MVDSAGGAAPTKPAGPSAGAEGGAGARLPPGEVAELRTLVADLEAMNSKLQARRGRGVRCRPRALPRASCGALLPPPPACLPALPACRLPLH